MTEITIIAEAGVNHNGCEQLAFRLVDAAVEAGADIIKFQTFKAKNMTTESAARAEYQIKNSPQEESQFQMLRKLELSDESHHKLNRYCQDKGIAFLSTAFDHQSLAFLVQELGLKQLKIGSGEITNAPLLLAHARTSCDLIISTGMASLSEIESALGVIAFGYTADKNGQPAAEAFASAYFSQAGQQALRKKVTLLHCTTEYPAPFNEVNLKAMSTLSAAFGLPTGYSDHTEGQAVSVAAVACGAVVIEKHFTLDQQMAGPDHKASLNPQQLKAMVQAIREVEQALGSGLKGPGRSESGNKIVVRKSLVAASNIKKGEFFSEKNLAIKRPGNGISPYRYWDMVGRQAARDYDAGELIVE